MGDDHLAVTPAQKQAGLTLVPPVWASIMGQGSIPAQPWEGWRLLEQGRLGELGAVHRFLLLNHFPAHRDLQPFSAVVESAARVPLRIMPAQRWQRRAAPELDFPADGRVPLAAADVPAIYVGVPASLAAGYPGRATFRLDLPRDTTVRARVAEVAGGGAGLRLTVDGRAAAEQHWPGGTPATELACPVPAGRHTLVIENTGGPDWLRISEIDLGLDTSALAAIGRRDDRLIALWLWHRTNLYAIDPAPPAGGTLVLDDVPAGTWRVVWWDTGKGVAGAPATLEHPGGTLRLSVPPLSRHAAVVLSR